MVEALRDALDRDPQLARRIARAALKRAACQLGWFTAVRDMLDGKPGAAVELSGAQGGPIGLHFSSAREQT